MERNFKKSKKNFYILIGAIILIVILTILILGKGGFINMQQIQSLIPSQFLSGISDYQTYIINQPKDLSVQRTNIKDGFKLNYEDIECSVVLSTPSLITYKNTADGIEWTNTFNVKEDILSLGSADLNFREFYNLICNKEVIKTNDEIIIKGNDFDLVFDFGTLKQVYSEPVIDSKTEQIISYSVKPQSYNLNYEVLNKSVKINVGLKDDYKSITGIKAITLGDKIVLDPTYTISNITLDADFDSITCEGGGYFCHLTTNLTAGLVLYMPFDVENNSATIYDWSKNSFDITTWTGVPEWQETGGINSSGAYNFDGGNDKFNIAYISYPNLNSLFDDEVTINLWIKFGSYTAHGVLLWRANSFSLQQSSAGGGYIRGGVWDLVGDNRFNDATTQLSVETWYMLSMTYNGSNASLWVNAVPVTSDTDASGVMLLENDNLEIGGTSAYESNATIDEVMIFNRSLSAEEIAQIYAQTFPKFESPTGNHTINQTIVSGNNRVNITIQHSNQPNSNLSLRIWDGTSWTDRQNMSDNTNTTFTISTSATNLNLSFEYISSNSKFWSPILLPNIILDTWTEGEAPPSDGEYPLFITAVEPANATQYYPRVYNFSATITKTNGTLGLEFSGVNYTLSNETDGSVFNKTFSDLGAGTYAYYYWAYGNGTSHNYNSSLMRYYTIAQNTTQLFTPLLNGANANLTITYPQQINASLSGNSTTASININGTTITSGNNYSWGAGGWLVNYSAQDNGNYSAFETSLNLLVNQAGNPLVTLLNGVANNLTATYPQQVNVSVSGNNTPITIKVNGTTFTSGNNYTLGANIWFVNVSAISNQNYTANESYWYITMNQASQTATLSINETSPIIYGKYINVTCDGELFRQNVNVTTEKSKSILLGVASWDYQCLKYANQNYSFDDDNSTFVVNQAGQFITLLLNGATSDLTINYPQEINASYSGTSNGTTLELNINQTSVIAGNNYTWGVGGWLVNWTLPSNQNYTYNASYLNLTINKAGSIVTINLNMTKNNVTITTGDSVNITATLTTGETGSLTLYNNGSIINSGTSPLYNLTTFANVGLYNITSYYEGSQNYTSNWSIMRYVNVTGADTTPPTFDNLRNFTHTVNTSFSQSITATDETALDGYFLNQTTSFTINRVTGLITNSTPLGIIFIYYLNISANDTSNNWVSGIFFINVTAVPPLPTASSKIFIYPTFNNTVIYIKLGERKIFI